MIEISYRTLKKAAAMFAGIPILFFFFSWLNFSAAMLFSVLLDAAFIFFFRSASRNDGDETVLSLTKKQFWIVAVVAVLWCIFAGQGSLFNQTSDHIVRNMILADMTLKPSPVTYEDGQNMLSYYIAYWMVPCTIGRMILLLSGSTYAALLVSNLCLLVQSCIGIFITLLLVLLLTNPKGKAASLKPIFFFIFFSGLDIVGMLLLGSTDVLDNDHIEWWAECFQYSSNTTCLFWVYNQTVAAWLMTLCLINEKHMQDFAFLALLAFPHGPFPFVGIFLFCIIRAVLCILNAVKQKTLAQELKRMLSPQNFLSVFAIAPVFILYFTANGVVTGSSGLASEEHINTSLHIHTILTQAISTHDSETIFKFWRNYLAFVLLEAGVFIIFLLYRKVQRTLTACVFVFLLLIPLLQLGYANDFCMRVSIPLLVYICIMFTRMMMTELPDKGTYSSLDAFIKGKKLLTVALLVFALGASTSVMEISRQLLLTGEWFFHRETTEIDMIRFDYENIPTLEGIGEYNNFSAVQYQESNFYKYFCKRTEE